MTRSTAAAGFAGPAALVSSRGLLDTVVGCLAAASLSICLIVTLTLLSGQAGMALPLPV